MDSTRGLGDVERPDTNTNFDGPFETQLESAIFDARGRFLPEIAGNLNWHPREDYTNASAFSFSTVGIEAPYVFQDQRNGWSALPFQGGDVTDNLSAENMPPLVHRPRDAEEYEVDLLSSPTSTLNQNIPPSSASHTGSFGSPTLSKFNWHEKKPQRDRGTRRKAEAVYRKKRQDVDEEIRNFLEWRGIKSKSVGKNALKLLDLCKELATENSALRETCRQCTQTAR